MSADGAEGADSGLAAAGEPLSARRAVAAGMGRSAISVSRLAGSIVSQDSILRE